MTYAAVSWDHISIAQHRRVPRFSAEDDDFSGRERGKGGHSPEYQANSPDLRLEITCDCADRTYAKSFYCGTKTGKMIWKKGQRPEVLILILPLTSCRLCVMRKGILKTLRNIMRNLQTSVKNSKSLHYLDINVMLLHLGRVRLVSHVDGPKQDPPLGNGDISTFALQSSYSKNVEESAGVQHISLRCKKSVKDLLFNSPFARGKKFHLPSTNLIPRCSKPNNLPQICTQKKENAKYLRNLSINSSFYRSKGSKASQHPVILMSPLSNMLWAREELHAMLIHEQSYFF
ncbi:hypothetical protein Q9966_000654 [Columba livia]|nr:hypothetical protein Q9966_000654 [Columba livia]